MYSREVFDFFQRALHFERQDRFANIESFIEEARHLLQQPSVTGLSLADINAEIQRNAPINRPPVKQMAILEDPTGIISRQDIQRELEEDLQSHSTIEHEKMSGDVERIRAPAIQRQQRKSLAT